MRRRPLIVLSCLVLGVGFAVPAAADPALWSALQRGGHAHVTHIDMPVSPSRVWSAING